MPRKKNLTYKEAGVDINAGNNLVSHIKTKVKSTLNKNVLASVGGFSALYQVPKNLKDPVLVSSTDGVGTKLKLAIESNHHKTIGMDLVAMCVNDIIVCGAKPLFFLDYFATGKLKLKQARDIISGITKGCELAQCALIGGETAEMPGLYQENDYDLAGFTVGIIEKHKIINGAKIKPQDQLIALASSGIHSNGYSLVRKILSANKIRFNEKLGTKKIIDLLLTPTKIYVNTILNLQKKISIKGMAHITGGGLIENVPRFLPKHCSAVIHKNSWQRPALFQWLQAQGNISEQEMLRTFNCGVGMVICVAKKDVDKTLKYLNNQKEHAWHLGEIVKFSKKSVLFQ